MSSSRNAARSSEVAEEDGDPHVVLTGSYGDWRRGWGPTDLPAGRRLREPSPLFKKLDPGIVEDELSRLATA